MLLQVRDALSLQVAVKLEPGDGLWLQEPGLREQPTAADHLLQEPAAHWPEGGGREETPDLGRPLRAEPAQVRGSLAVPPGPLGKECPARPQALVPQPRCVAEPWTLLISKQPRGGRSFETWRAVITWPAEEPLQPRTREGPNLHSRHPDQALPAHLPLSLAFIPGRLWWEAWNVSPEKRPTCRVCSCLRVHGLPECICGGPCHPPPLKGRC